MQHGRILLPGSRLSLLRMCSRFESTPSDSTSANYRSIAEASNNPYRPLYEEIRGRKPRTFRERFIESKKNQARPRIRDDCEKRDEVTMAGSTENRQMSFYKDRTRSRFVDLGISGEISRQIAELGVVNPTFHQSDVIPVLLEKKNCVFISPTGSGNVPLNSSVNLVQF